MTLMTRLTYIIHVRAPVSHVRRVLRSHIVRHVRPVRRNIQFCERKLYHHIHLCDASRYHGKRPCICLHVCLYPHPWLHFFCEICNNTAPTTWCCVLFSYVCSFPCLLTSLHLQALSATRTVERQCLCALHEFYTYTTLDLIQQYMLFS